MSKKILYVDMDSVLVDFAGGIDALDEETKAEFKERLDEVPDIFGKMKPIRGAVETYERLSKKFNAFILSTAPWENETAWSDKIIWVRKYLGEVAHKRLILSHHKELNRGHFLIDDRYNNGAVEFEGEWIQFATEEFPGWAAVERYLAHKD
ncbi:MAG: hypothetical protein PF588_03020 [Candidatus Kapabacteria bacterium]|jgi:5'-nucleotidase|nr:hypothetical protein [Candidatus Kapabacteria bacterium]